MTSVIVHRCRRLVSSEPSNHCAGLGIFVPNKTNDEPKEETAGDPDFTAPASTSSSTDAEDRAKMIEESASGNISSESLSTQGPRNNVLSISSLLSTNLPATIAAPITQRGR